MKIKYQCEICENVYDDKKSAEECESYGIDEPLLNIGDIITICDCKKTPIMFIKYRDVYPRYEYERCVPNGNILYYIEKVCDRKIKCKLAFIEKSSPHSLRYVFYPVEENFQFFRIEMQQYQLKNQLKYYNKIESEEIL